MTSKMPIKWHRECYKNFKASCERNHQNIELLLRQSADQDARLAFYGQQIEEAERRNLDGFDEDKFMKKRATKAEV
jgi:hypothetical protein